LAAELPGHARDRLPVDARTGEQDRRAAWDDERQTPFRGHRRRSQRLRDGDAVNVHRLLLGAAADDPGIRQLPRPALEKLALAPIRFEQGHLTLGQRDCEWYPGRATAGTNVDDWAFELPHDLDRPQAVVIVNSARVLRRDRGQAWRRDESLEPALDHSGSTTTKRLGSVPSLRVLTPGTSLRHR